MRALRCCCFFFGYLASVVWAAPPAPQTLPLWPDGPPNANGLTGTERAGGCVGNISEATLTVHLPDPRKATGKAIVVIPGGGYGVVCTDTEGEQIAQLLTPAGVAAIVLKYRLPNGHHLIPANDARRAIRTVRSRAKAWNIDPQDVGVWGFSAGGHLASTVATVFKQPSFEPRDAVDRLPARPDFAILFYPVISMETGVTHKGSQQNLLGSSPTKQLIQTYSNEQQVSPRTPPTFLLHAADDQVVTIENTLRYYRQLVTHGVSGRCVLFESGGHGPGAFRSHPEWQPTFLAWLKQQ